MMARIRTIKPEFWRDELLAGVTSEAALLELDFSTIAMTKVISMQIQSWLSQTFFR